MTRPLCLHCRDRQVARGMRGLCRPCWNTPRIRNRYLPSEHAPTRRGETLADLDALIAERMKPENLPSWWPAEAARERGAVR